MKGYQRRNVFFPWFHTLPSAYLCVPYVCVRVSKWLLWSENYPFILTNLSLCFLCVFIALSSANSVLQNWRPHMMRPTGSHSSYHALRGQTIELECIVQGLWVSVCAHVCTCVHYSPRQSEHLSMPIWISLSCLSSISLLPALFSFRYLSIAVSWQLCCLLPSDSYVFLSFLPVCLFLSLRLTFKPHSVSACPLPLLPLSINIPPVSATFVLPSSVQLPRWRGWERTVKCLSPGPLKKCSTAACASLIFLRATGASTSVLLRTHKGTSNTLTLWLWKVCITPTPSHILSMLMQGSLIVKK